MERDEVASIARVAIRDAGLDDNHWLSAGVEGLEITRAILSVLTKRLGPSFADEVGAALTARMEQFAAWGDPFAIEQSAALEHSDIWRDLAETPGFTSDGPSAAPGSQPRIPSGRSEP